MVNALELRGVSRSFGDFALQNIDLTLPGGRVMGLIGQNGAGKSTLMRLIMDTLRRDAGSIAVLGVDNLAAEFAAVKQDIGVVPDSCGLPEGMTVADIGRFMSLVYTNWQQAQYAALLQRFKLPPNKKVKSLSRGMQQKLGIACALSHQARLLLLDEATAGLDPLVRDEILDVFREFVCDDEHSILISSHISSDLEKICDYIACLHQGELLFCAEKDALLEEYAIWQGGEEAFADLAEDAVVAVQHLPYGIKALVKRVALPAGLSLEKPSLDDLFLLIVKQKMGVGK